MFLGSIANFRSNLCGGVALVGSVLLTDLLVISILISSGRIHYLGANGFIQSTIHMLAPLPLPLPRLLGRSPLSCCRTDS